MKYEIRYLANNEEHSELVEVESAAEAAEVIRQRNSSDPNSTYELIQVSLIDETSDETSTPAS